MNESFFDAFPLVETERLHLRELADDDAAAVYAVFRDEDVVRFYDCAAMTAVDEARDFIVRMRARFTGRTGIRWAIVDKSDERVIGTIGFNQIIPWARRGVLGYEIGRTWWGRGFVTEAVRAVVTLGHDALALGRIEALVMLENEASVRVLLKAGFEEEGVLRAYGFWKGRYHDLRMFSSVQIPAA